MLGLLVPPSAHTFFYGCITLCIHTHVLVNKTKNYISVFLRDKDKHFGDRAEKQTRPCFCDHQCKDLSSLIGHRGKSGKLGDLRVSLRLAALLLLYIFIIHCWHVLWLSFEYTYEIISYSLIGQERFSRLPIQDIREFQARTI